MNQNLITEKHNVEFKESWRDEYLKWICGFANAQGGTLYIGVKDNGEVCGVENPKRRSCPKNETINSTNETIKHYDVEKLKEEVIKIVKEDSTITKEEMAKKIGISRSTLQRALRKIPNLTFVGASKSGHWEIKIN